MKGKKKTMGALLRIPVYLILVMTALITLLPLGWVISTSLRPGNEIFVNPPYWISKKATIVSYYHVLFESEIPRALLNSLLVDGMTMVISLLLGGSAGYAFARFQFRGNKALSLFMLLSQMLPLTVLMVPMYYMENAVDLVDTKIGLVIAHLSISMPFVTWMAEGYSKGIPKEIEEAAVMDGCSTLQTMFYIIVPLPQPTLAATGTCVFISSWSEFTLANMLTRGMTSRTVPIALNEFSSFFKVDRGDTMAAAMLITIPIIVVSMLVQKQFVEGLANGAVKG